MNCLSKDKRLAESSHRLLTMIATSHISNYYITKQSTDENRRTDATLAEDGQNYTRSCMVNASA
jgi:hypothetical protein